MAQALALAEDSIGLASPNPQVGCVLVRDGSVLAEGAHRYANLHHAEIVALNQAAAAGHATAGATAYVTLEPCSHHGRTGPCADALIAAGITRCVVATSDPNPAVGGRGIAKLRAAGVEVVVGPGQPAARALNNPFAFSIQHQRPFVTLKAALSSDGFLAPPASARAANQPHWLTGPESRAEVQRLRHASDAILTGIGTVLADNPALTDRTGLPRRRPLLRVVFDTHLRTPLTSQLIRLAQATRQAGHDSDLLLLCGPSAPTDRLAHLESLGAEVYRLPGHLGRLSLAAALDLLFARDIRSVLLEAGSALNGAALAQHLVDRAILFYTDRTLGPTALPFADDLAHSSELEAQLTDLTRARLGPDLRVSGLLHDPWLGVPSAAEP